MQKIAWISAAFVILAAGALLGILLQAYFPFPLPNADLQNKVNALEKENQELRDELEKENQELRDNLDRPTPKLTTSLNEDREALCGDGKSVWEFENAGPRVQLYFAKGGDGKPDRIRIGYLTELPPIGGLGGKGLEASLGYESDFKLAEKDSKRYIKVNQGLPIQETGFKRFRATRFDAKGSDTVLLRYKLEGDKLELLSGRHEDLDLKGVWKRVALGPKGQ